MLSAMRFGGQKLDGKEDKGNLGHSSNLNPLGRYLRPSQISTSPTIKNLRFFIFLRHLAANCIFSCPREHNIMPRIFSDP